MTCFWEKKKKKTLENIIYFPQNDTPLKRKHSQFSRFLLASLPGSARAQAPDPYLASTGTSLVVRGQTRPFQTNAGTVGLGQSTREKAAWNNGPFLSSAAHTLLTQPSELRKQKMYLPTTSASHLAPVGQLLRLGNEGDRIG